MASFQNKDRVRVRIDEPGEISYTNGDSSFDVALDKTDGRGNNLELQYVDAQFLTRTDFPVQLGDVWRTPDGKVWVVYYVASCIRVRRADTNGDWYDDSAIEEFEKLNPELLYRVTS